MRSGAAFGKRRHAEFVADIGWRGRAGGQMWFSRYAAGIGVDLEVVVTIKVN